MDIDHIEEIVRRGDIAALELAWALNEFYPSWAEDVGIESEYLGAREARREYLSFICSQFPGVARRTFEDRFAFGRFWTRKRYDSLWKFLGWQPSYHQVRALTTNETEAERRLHVLTEWMRVNERIPTVEELHEMFDPNGLDTRTRALRTLRRACNRVLTLEAGTRNLRAAVHSVLDLIDAEADDE